MVDFVYCPEDNLTFEAWYERYEQDIFTAGAAQMTNAEKVSLLTQKLSTCDYEQFKAKITPATKATVLFADAVKALKQQFGRKDSQFSIRYKCLTIHQGPSETIEEYANRVNLKCNKFDLPHFTIEDLKVLTFLTGLKTEMSHMREKLLVKLNAEEMTREGAVAEAAAGADRAVPAKLTLNDMIGHINAIDMAKEQNVSITDPRTPQTEVMAVQNKQPSKQFKSTKPNVENKPKSPCRACGAWHRHRDCPFKGKECGHCKKNDHKEGYCGSWADFKKYVETRYPRGTNNQSNKVSVMSVAARKFVEPTIEGKKLRLQMDTASDWTIISKENWKQLDSPALTP
ncbi:PREDICTED: uncharacterized protein LOC105555933, partial [Vollenhovia emeryi]|uniref:uncharacterized protein LOC105555933 n=1 Tax=Vollenhovia emeryi TaxID=411798 RepID=UPI0005F58307